MAKDYSDKAGTRRVEYLPLDAIKPAKANPKRHADEAIRQSMDRWGYTEPLLLDERTGHLVAGHGRLQSLLDKRESGDSPPEGITADWQVPVTRGWASKNDDEANGYLVADNRLTELGGWDNRELLALLDSLDDLEGVGYTLDEIQELSAKVTELPPTPMTDPDAVPAPPKTPVTKLGDVWELGTHRVMCGDSSDVLAIDKLLDGQRPQMIFTDPPYGMKLDVRYDSMHSGKGRRVTGERFKKVQGDDEAFDQQPFAGLFDDVLEQFWWGADYYRTTIPDGGSWVVWDKRDNDKGMNLDAVVGASFELCWSRQQHKRVIARILWSGQHGMQGEDTKSRVHPTQKPVALVEWFMERWGAIGDLVLDLFAGSGSTLMGCQRTGRNAYLMELDPQYVDVICRRFQEHTGIKPVLESTGEPVDFAEPKVANVA